MPDDINGNYSLPNGYLAVTGEKVLPSNHNPPLEDIAEALTARYSRDGRAPMLGNVPMNGFRVIGMADGTDANHAITKSQLDTIADAKLNKDGSNADATFLSGQKWMSKAIGELYAVDDSMTGADVPPTDDSRFRYIKLTAGLTGSGQYNNGVLTSESVSGSAPLVIATAVISLSGSPLDGRTVNLLNTERRFLRAGSAGTVEQDTVQEHDHANSLISPGGSAAGASGASYTLRSAGAVSGARTSNETRAKNLGVTYFMRIK